MIDRWLHGGRPARRLRRPAAGRGQAGRSSPASTATAGPAAAAERHRLGAAPTDFSELEPPLTEAEARAGRRPLPGLRRLFGVPPSASPPARRRRIDLDMRAAEVRGRGRQPSSCRPATGSSPPTSSRSTAAGGTRTSSPARRWTGCSPPPAPSTPCCGRATARCPSASPTSCARARATRRSATRSARKFCCMYSIKQNQLIMGALPLADVTVHYIDIRAAGQALRRVLRAGQGHGRHLREGPGRQDHREGERQPVLRYEDIENGGTLVGGRVRPRRPRRRASSRTARPSASSPTRSSALDEYDYVGGARRGPRTPAQTSIPGRLRGRRRVGREGHPRLDPARRRRCRPGGGPPGTRRRRRPRKVPA